MWRWRRIELEAEADADVRNFVAGSVAAGEGDGVREPGVTATTDAVKASLHTQCTRHPMVHPPKLWAV